MTDLDVTPAAAVKFDASLRILAVDVGGSGVKAAILDHEGKMLTERARLKTPHPCPPDVLVNTIEEVVKMLGQDDFRAVSVGFPGVVRGGKILTAPNLGTELLAGFDLGAAVSERFGGRPVRVLNDADMQGLGTVEGHGVEMVVTLGTGFGTALFVDGRLAPHLEISHLPLAKDQTYDERVGNEARDRVGNERWNRRVKKVIELMRILTNFDRLYVGGGNAKHVEFELPDDVRIASNENGLRGGAWLWRDGGAEL